MTTKEIRDRFDTISGLTKFYHIRGYLKSLCDIIDAQQAEIDELKKKKQNKPTVCGGPFRYPGPGKIR